MSLEAKAIVFFVCADPKPQDDITLPETECAIMISYSHNTDVVAPLFKSKRWMEWIQIAYFSRASS